jgi:hypothetical protein
MPYYIVSKNDPNWRRAERVQATTPQDALRGSRFMERLMVEASGAGQWGARLAALVSERSDGEGAHEYQLFMQITSTFKIEAA